MLDNKYWNKLDPSFNQVSAIFMLFTQEGKVRPFTHLEKQSTQNLKSYCSNKHLSP